MRILLVGEYSNLHNSLKTGLKSLGHEVLLVSSGDYFKNFDSDFKIISPFKNGILKKLNSLLFRIFKIDLNGFYVYYQIRRLKSNFINYDVVQLINQTPFDLLPNTERKIFDLLHQNNQRVFVLCCGVDSNYLNFAQKNKDFPSVLTPYVQNKLNPKTHQAVFKYLQTDYQTYFDYITKYINGHIATDFDYLIPLKNHPKLIAFIPYPIAQQSQMFEENRTLVILHGINSRNYYKKGNDVFEAVLKKIATNYPDIIIKTTYDLPYSAYLPTLKSCDILLDQLYANDQGYNALLGMSFGKVVFTGSCPDFLDHYELNNNQVCVHALHDDVQLYQMLSEIINNQALRQSIRQNAVEFVKKHHDLQEVSNHYLNVWHSH